MSSKVKLPKKDEFLLELANNNYSTETIYNYARDLGIFEHFLGSKGYKFRGLDKRILSLYKGFLRSGKHLTILQKRSAQELQKGRGAKSPDISSQIKQSRSRGSRSVGIGKGGLSSRSVNRMLSALRTYLTFLIDHDYRCPIPPESVKLIKAERKESQVAELDDLIRLVEAPETFEKDEKIQIRNRAILELIFATGMRISEVVGLNREQLNLTAGFSEDGSEGSDEGSGQGFKGSFDSSSHHSEPVERSAGLAQDKRIKEGKIFIMGKGKKQRFVYLTDRAKKQLERYLATRKDKFPALFIPYRGQRASTKDPDVVRISTNYIQNKIAEYRRRLGIVVPTSAHSLRHGFATYLAESGANPAAIQRLLGHESLQTTTRYVHSSDKFAEESHRKFHPLKK